MKLKSLAAGRALPGGSAVNIQKKLVPPVAPADYKMPPPSAGDYQIFVKTLTGKTYTILANSSHIGTRK
jgi:hypothetical protein